MSGLAVFIITCSIKVSDLVHASITVNVSSLSSAVEYDIMGPTNATVPNVTTTSIITPTPTISPLPTVVTSPTPAASFNPYWWQGVAFFLQNLFIFLRYGK